MMTFIVENVFAWLFLTVAFYLFASILGRMEMQKRLNSPERTAAINKGSQGFSMTNLGRPPLWLIALNVLFGVSVILFIVSIIYRLIN